MDCAGGLVPVGQDSFKLHYICFLLKYLLFRFLRNNSGQTFPFRESDFIAAEMQFLEKSVWSVDIFQQPVYHGVGLCEGCGKPSRLLKRPCGRGGDSLG